MLAEQVEVAGLGHRLLGDLRHLIWVGEPHGRLGQERGQLVGLEAGERKVKLEAGQFD